MNIAFVSTYLPTNCGIAKFTNSLIDAIRFNDPSINAKIVRLIVQDDVIRDDVFINIRKYEEQDYIRAAEAINNSDVDLVNLQHEYGIFGGEWGDYILRFLEHVDKPVVSVLHTLEPEYPEYAREIIRRIWDRSSKVILTLPNMHSILKERFKIDADKLYKYIYIPHGVPSVDINAKDIAKKNLMLDDKIVLVSFGLLKPEKGFEYVIDALKMVDRDDIIYLIIGKDHPEYVRKSKGSYIKMLKDKVKELRLDDKVRFVEKFFDDEQELSNYLLAGDILLTPYLKVNQVSSGVIVYGMAHGMCIITTPFTHARNDIKDDVGRIVRHRDSKDIANAIIDLIKDRDKLRIMQRKAYEHVKDRQWHKVARLYIDVFKSVINK